MGEASALARVIMAVGFLSLFGILIYSSAGPPVFQNLNSFPQFNNPFAAGSTVTITSPDAVDPYSLTAYESVTGCTDAAYWKCVNSNDGDLSYVTLNTVSDLAGSLLRVHMRNIGTGGDALRLVLTIYCRSVGSPTFTDNVIGGGGGVTFSVPSCPESEGFQPITVAIENLPEVTTLATVNGAATGILLRNHRSNGGLNGDPDPNAGTGKIEITYMELAVTQQIGAAAPCGALDVGCAIGRFVTPVVQGITFVINFFIFIGQWLLYVATFFSDLFLILIWFFTIPGTPPIVQGIIDVIIMGLLGFLTFLMVKIVRGVGGL